MPWNNGAAVVLWGRDIIFDRAQRAALCGELDSTRSIEQFSNALTYRLARGLNRDLLVGVLLQALSKTLSMSGVQLLRGTQEENLKLVSLTCQGPPLSSAQTEETCQALTQDCSFIQIQEDGSLLAVLDATRGQAPLVIVAWKDSGQALSASQDLPLLRDDLKRLRAV